MFNDEKKGQEVWESDSSDPDLYRIGDLASEFDVSLRTLRFYEDKGLLAPRRAGVTRLYTRRDRARLKLILRGKRIGFSLSEVKQIIDLYEPGSDNVPQLRFVRDKGEEQMTMLERQQKEIEDAIGELRQTLDQVNRLLDEAEGAQPKRQAR